jgi:hypothetical protein
MKKCRTCEYFVRDELEGEDVTGTCHRYPPDFGRTDCWTALDGHLIWPAVYGRSLPCGEYKESGGA